MTVPEDDRWPAAADRAYRESVEAVVARLRRMADDVEREALDYGPPINGVPRGRMRAAASAQHALFWGLANASAERLTRDAESADTAQREAAQETA